MADYDDYYYEPSHFVRNFPETQFRLQDGSKSGKKTDASIWMSFNPGRGVDGLYISVYDSDYDFKNHPFKFNGSHPDEIPAFIAKVEAAYDTKIPKVYTALSQKYLSLAADAFGIYTVLESVAAYCEQCGDTNITKVEASYFPATDGDGGYVDVDYSHGCYGNDTVSTDFNDEDGMDTAFSILESAVRYPDNPRFVGEINGFKDKLKQMYSAHKVSLSVR